MGTVISLPISGVLCDYLGWESVFYVFGCLGLVWFICWTIFVYDNPEKWVHTELKDLSFGKKSFCFITFRFFPSQCDQMVILLIQYLAIYSNEHLPHGQSRFKILPNMNETLRKLPKILKCSPKWRNFAKSGHTADVMAYVLTYFPTQPMKWTKEIVKIPSEKERGKWKNFFEIFREEKFFLQSLKYLHSDICSIEYLWGN